jgi:hypothetical protein
LFSKIENKSTDDKSYSDSISNNNNWINSDQTDGPLINGIDIEDSLDDATSNLIKNIHQSFLKLEVNHFKINSFKINNLLLTFF